MECLQNVQGYHGHVSRHGLLMYKTRHGRLRASNARPQDEMRFKKAKASTEWIRWRVWRSAGGQMHLSVLPVPPVENTLLIT